FGRDTDLRALIRRMSVDNPLWGAPRIHGELLNLGFEFAQSSIAKYMDRPPSAGAESCATTRRTSRPWICSLLRPLALICSMVLSLSIGPQAPGLGCRHHKSHRRVDCSPDQRGIPLERGSPLSDP